MSGRIEVPIILYYIQQREHNLDEIWWRYGGITKEKMNNVIVLQPSNFNEIGHMIYRWKGIEELYNTMLLTEYFSWIYIAYSQV